MICQGGATGYRLRTTPLAAAPRTDAASASGEPAGTVAGSIGSTWWAIVVPWTRSHSARAVTRRIQPRTVSAGIPSSGPIVRWLRSRFGLAKIQSAQSPQDVQYEQGGVSDARLSLPQVDGAFGVRSGASVVSGIHSERSPQAGVAGSNPARRTECLCRSEGVAAPLGQGSHGRHRGSWSACGQQVVSGCGRPVAPRGRHR